MGATFGMIKSQSSGGTIYAADWNAEFLNILNNLNPAGVDDESANVTAMQTVVDPYPGGSASLATSLQGELQRLRYLLVQITGETYWYIDPDYTIPALAVVNKNYISGLEISSHLDADHDIVVALGCATDSSNTYMMPVTSAFVKKIDEAWAAGSAQGGMFSGAGTVQANTWYHVFLIRADATGVIDAGFDTSITAANIPMGYTAYRRISSVYTDASANITPFTQHGGTTRWKVAFNNYGAAPPNTDAVTQGVTAPPGVQTEAILGATYAYASGDAGYLLITSPEETDTVPSPAAMDAIVSADGAFNSLYKKVWTNTSSQVRWRSTSTTTTVYLFTQGWVDLRGQ